MSEYNMFLLEETEHRNKFFPNAETLEAFGRKKLIDYFVMEFQKRDIQNRYHLTVDRNRVFFSDSRSQVMLKVGMDHFQIDFDFMGSLVFSAVYEGENPSLSYCWKDSGVITAPALHIATDVIMNKIKAMEFAIA